MIEKRFRFEKKNQTVNFLLLSKEASKASASREKIRKFAMDFCFIRTYDLENDAFARREKDRKRQKEREGERKKNERERKREREKKRKKER